MKLYSFRLLVERAGISPSFVNRLEEAELIHPLVKNDETFYSEQDLKRLLLAKDLREMGINFAGIEVILEIRDHMFNMRKETDQVLYRLLNYLDESIIDRKY